MMLSGLARVSKSVFVAAAVRCLSTHSRSVLECVGDGADRREGNKYWVKKEEVEAFHRDGYLSLPGVVTEDEILEIEDIYMKFMNREIDVPGKDFCDMSQGYDVPFEEYQIINAMLPRKYYPPLQGNIYEIRAAHINEQLWGEGFDIDYDQFLAKKPNKNKAVFAWHWVWDMAYWPVTEDTRTATFSLALDTTTLENGCLEFVAGTHNEPTLRNHRPFAEELAKQGELEGTSRDDAHALQVVLKDDDHVTAVPIPRCGVSIHNESVLHGSGGNYSKGWRRTYVCAFRTKETIAWERERRFDHSHNAEFNWDQFHDWNKK